MNKTPEEKAEATIVWVLNQLQEQIALQKYTDKLIVITIDIEEWRNQNSDSPPISDIRHVILKMQRKWDIFEIVERTGTDKDKSEPDWNKVTYFVLEIDNHKFRKFSDRYNSDKTRESTSKSIDNLISSLKSTRQKRIIRALRNKGLTAKKLKEIAGVKYERNLITNMNKGIRKIGFKFKIAKSEQKEAISGESKYYLSTP